MTDARKVLDEATTEDEFLRAVVEYAHLHGWLVHHTRPAPTGKGWRTPIQGDAGFPDLVLVRDGRLIFAELKREGGRIRDEQRHWLDALFGVDNEVFERTVATGPEVERWRDTGVQIRTVAVEVLYPSDWPSIERMLA